MATAVIHFGAALVLAWTTLSVPSLAAEPAGSGEAARPVAVELSEAALASYERGDYARALALFGAAYEREPDPNLLFNIARTHEKLGQLEQAIEHYERFLASPDGDAAGRDKAESSRDELVKSRERERARRQRQATAGEPPDDSAAERRVVSAESGGLTPWLLLGAGVVVLASGAVVYSLGMSDHGEVEDQAGYGDPNRVTPMTQRQARERVDSGNGKKLVGGLLLGGGGALVASSALLFVLDGGSNTTVGVKLNPEAAGLTLRGRF